MSSTVKGILQKINFIEKDMELHKQILFSIEADDKDQIERVIKQIADFKAQIEELRLKIKEVDESEYYRIIRIEAGTLTFRKLSENKSFKAVNTLNDSGQCRVTLSSGETLECLVAAQEESGDWCVLTVDGDVRELGASEVQSE